MNNKIRPVRCWVCGDPMYYAGDDRHEPEFFVAFGAGGGEEPEEQFYVHQRCWKEVLSERSKK